MRIKGGVAVRALAPVPRPIWPMGCCVSPFLQEASPRVLNPVRNEPAPGIFAAFCGIFPTFSSQHLDLEVVNNEKNLGLCCLPSSLYRLRL